MNDQKISQRALKLLSCIEWCGEFPVRLLDKLSGCYDYNRRLITKSVRHGYLRERVLQDCDRHVVRSLSLTASGRALLRRSGLDGPWDTLPPLAPRDGCGNREKTLRLHRQAVLFVLARRLSAVWLPLPEKDSFLGRQLVYYSSYELCRRFGWDSKGARLSGVFFTDHLRCFPVYYLGNHNMRWNENAECYFRNRILAQFALLPIRLEADILIGERWELAAELVKYGSRKHTRLIPTDRGMSHCFSASDENGLKLLRLLLYESENERFLRYLWQCCQIWLPVEHYFLYLDELTAMYRSDRHGEWHDRHDHFYFDFQEPVLRQLCAQGLPDRFYPGSWLDESRILSRQPRL